MTLGAEFQKLSVGGGKYISLDTHYFRCVIAVTFKVEWTFCTF